MSSRTLSPAEVLKHRLLHGTPTFRGAAVRGFLTATPTPDPIADGLGLTLTRYDGTLEPLGEMRWSYGLGLYEGPAIHPDGTVERVKLSVRAGDQSWEDGRFSVRGWG